MARRPDSSYSPLRSEQGGDHAPTEMGLLFPECDYEHWLIVMDKPSGEGASKQQMIDCYIQTLAKVVGSEEEAKKRIYNVSCERYFGFRCEIDEDTSNKLEGLLGVLFVLLDSYIDAENKDYGGIICWFKSAEFSSGSAVTPGFHVLPYLRIICRKRDQGGAFYRYKQR